jgi:hypothetical protein
MADREGPSARTLALWLHMVLFDLHPWYASTARRDRGPGGSTVTQQCNVIDPEGWEFGALDDAVDDLRAYIQANPDFIEHVRVTVADLRKPDDAKGGEF